MNTTRPQVVARVALTRAELNIILTALTLYVAGTQTVGEAEATAVISCRIKDARDVMEVL